MGGPACSISAAPSPVKGIYVFWSNLDIAGSFTVTCTRGRFDSRTPRIWIGVDQPTGGQSMPRDIGGSTLNYFIYRRNFGNGVWTSSGNESATSNAAGGLRVQLNFRNATALTSSFNFYFRMPRLQFKAAGVYFDAPLAVTLRSNNANGALLNTGSVTTLISIQDNCRFSTDPAPVAVNYPAFATAPVVRTSTFGLVCTQTPITRCRWISRTAWSPTSASPTWRPSAPRARSSAPPCNRTTP
ncbi:fimbrial major subunit CsuA/B family protein [Ramlibacter terrae]|uniref:Fimbrial major subunit CsuA/B family protein n=1 Tax=Ramlibacter terrae TaxID=2732511 RepID=A0ABX6P1D8_9BURK|nr:fimbrial major subunit CsuA/B family protein [Ramlibacter terrae]